MKEINLRGVLNTLNESEMKQVKGGDEWVDDNESDCPTPESCGDGAGGAVIVLSQKTSALSLECSSTNNHNCR